MMSIHRVAMAKIAVSLVSISLGLAACGAAPASAGDRLVAEMEACSRNERLRETVLVHASWVDDPRLAPIGMRYLHDKTPTTQLFAYVVAMKDMNDAPALIVAGLATDNPSVQCACAGRAAEIVGCPEIDRALEKVMEECHHGTTLEAAFASYVRRNGREGADRVYKVVRNRGDGYLPLAAPALSQLPDDRYEPVFQAAIADGRYGEFGRRGLGLAGLRKDPTFAARAAQYGLERSLAEYSDSYEEHERNLSGGLRLSSPGEMFREAADAEVVILAEVHFDGFVKAWEIGILTELCHLWGGPAKVGFLYERRDAQTSLVPVAADLGCNVTECEPWATREWHQETQSKGWVMEERDDRAMQRITARCAGQEARNVIVYGAAHTAILEKGLRAQGKRVVRIVLASRVLRAAAMQLMGTMDVCGRVFRCQDGTYFVPARPSGVFGSPELDLVLAGRPVGEPPKSPPNGTERPTKARTRPGVHAPDTRSWITARQGGRTP